MDDQYKALCDQCDQQLTQDVHIFIMTNNATGEEQTICSSCRYDIAWPGWYDDEESDL
jgi:hypothetical protein